MSVLGGGRIEEDAPSEGTVNKVASEEKRQEKPPLAENFKPVEYPLDLKARETQLILETLKLNGGHRQKTAETLNISPRTLRYKLARLKEQGVSVP